VLSIFQKIKEKTVVDQDGYPIIEGDQMVTPRCLAQNRGYVILLSSVSLINLHWVRLFEIFLRKNLFFS
jgi:hypothetical protein